LSTKLIDSINVSVPLFPSVKMTTTDIFDKYATPNLEKNKSYSLLFQNLTIGGAVFFFKNGATISFNHSVEIRKGYDEKERVESGELIELADLFYSIYIDDGEAYSLVLWPVGAAILENHQWKNTRDLEVR
jgi:hypothetical protein